VSVLSASSTWSSWTGSAVWVIGIVCAEESVFADGLPGCSSTNQLPSRKIRGRIFRVASLWIGRPLRFDFHRHEAGCPSRLIEADLADVTPAMRTGDFGVDVDAEANTA
jgi:hypothetical protein